MVLEFILCSTLRTKFSPIQVCSTLFADILRTHWSSTSGTELCIGRTRRMAIRTFHLLFIHQRDSATHTSLILSVIISSTLRTSPIFITTIRTEFHIRRVFLAAIGAIYIMDSCFFRRLHRWHSSRLLRMN